MAIALTALVQPVAAQAPPPLPSVVSGVVSLSDGTAVPDGTLIVARISEYETPPVTVRDGAFLNLVIAPPDSSFVGRTASFYLVLNDSDGELIDSVIASGTVVFQPALIAGGLSLTFARVPMLPATPTPTPSPIPTATPSPTPSPTPTVTPTPEIAQPAIFAGFLVVIGGVVPDGARLVARIGSYESLPSLIVGEEFRNLVVDPRDPGLIGQDIEFFLDGVAASTVVEFASGGSDRNLDLIFSNLPTPSPTPSPSPTPTATLLPPTPTPEPPTPTPTTVVEPEATPDPSGFFGTCSAPTQDVPVRASVANGLLLLGPLGLIWAYRRRRSSGG